MEQRPNEWYEEGLRQQRPEVLRHIFAAFLPQVAHFIRHNSGTNEDAKDVFMYAVEVVVRKAQAGNLVLTASFGTFLTEICRRNWFKELRRKKFDAGVTPDDPAVYNRLSTEGDATFEQTDRYRLMAEKFNLLHDDCKKVLSLSWHTDLSMEAVAVQMNWTYAYARKRKSQCTAYLITAVKSDPRFGELRT